MIRKSTRVAVVVLGALILLAAVSLPVGAQSVSLAALQTTNFGGVNIGSSSTLTLTYNINANVTLASNVNVLTLGAPNLDFTPSGASTCTGSQSTGNTCAVTVSFAPLAPGLRTGAVQITDSNGNVLVTTLLRGNGLGPALAFVPGTQTTVGSGLYGPFAVVDGAGNIFIANTYNWQVVKVPTGCRSSSCQIIVGSGLNAPQSLALDGAGDLFVADTGNNRVVEFPGGCISSACLITVASGLNSPEGVALDGMGDVFIGDTHNNRVLEVPAGCTSSACQSTIASGLNAPAGLAVDGMGDVLIADFYNNRVLNIPAGCNNNSCWATVGFGLNGAADVALDGAGDVFITDYFNSRVVEVPTGCTASSCQTTVGSGLSYPVGVAVDGNGDVFIADTGNSRVLEFLRLQGPSLSFAPTLVGSASAPQTVTVQNVGNATLSFSSISASANFSMNPGSTTCSTSSPLGLGASCNVAVECTPAAIGSLSGMVTLTDNSLNGTPATQQIPLACTGLGTLLVTPSPVNFGTVNLYSLNEVTVTVTNNGTSAVRFSGANVTSGSAPAWAFPILDWCWGSLAPGKSCQIWVFYFGDAVGTRTATLNIADNAPGGGQQVSLTANVIDPIAQFNPWTLTFGNQAIGTSATQSVQLTNVGQTPLTISNIGIGGFNSGDFSQTSNCPSSLSPGGNCIINVTFDPTQWGWRQATLIVYDNVQWGQSIVWLGGQGGNNHH